MTIAEKKYNIALPGDKIATGNYKPGLGVYRDKGNLHSALIGLVNFRGPVVSVIPLEGRIYIPLEEDVVIGTITEVGARAWMVDIGGPYIAVLPASNVLDRNDSANGVFQDLSRIFQAGDMILSKVASFDRTRDPVLTMQQRGLKKLVNGRLINVSPVKIPRIIGKQGSMISLITNMTRSQVFVGQNGRILINAPDLETERLLIEIFEKIQKEAHIPGLTDRIKSFITEKIKK